MRTEMKFPEFDISAKIKFLSSAEGGRTNSAFSSYRPNHDFGLKEGLIDAVHEYVGTNEAHPGSQVYTHMVFLTPRLLLGKLTPGQEFRVQEGDKLIALGRISKIFRDELCRDS